MSRLFSVDKMILLLFLYIFHFKTSFTEIFLQICLFWFFFFFNHEMGLRLLKLMVWAFNIRPLKLETAKLKVYSTPHPGATDQTDKGMDGGQGVESDNRSEMRAPSLLSSQQPTTSPPSHKAPSSSLPCPWNANAGRRAHCRDKLVSTIFKTFWLGFGGEGLGVDFVKESKWGGSECRGCSILICVCGRFLSGSFPWITRWIPRSCHQPNPVLEPN